MAHVAKNATDYDVKQESPDNKEVLPYEDEARLPQLEGTIEAQLHGARYEKTQRGLKSRHAQMIAIGGTIGMSVSVERMRLKIRVLTLA